MIIVNNPAAGIGKNFFKNPNFAVIQGTASGTLANSTALPTASLGYLGETEWCIAAAGGTPAYAFSAANESVTFTGAASTTAIHLLQRLESLDTNRLKNKTVTFSCELSNSLLTSVIWEVFRPTTSDDVHGTIATPTQTLVASGTFTVSSTLTRYSTTFALPDLASRGLEIRLRVGAQTSGTWVVSRLQLEEGSVATAFNCGDYPKELRKCQRYYSKQAPQGVAANASFTVGASGSGNYAIFGGEFTSYAAQNISFPEVMRVAPALAFTDATGAAGLSTNSGNGQTPLTNFVPISDSNFSIMLKINASFCYFRWAASAHIT